MEPIRERDYEMDINSRRTLNHAIIHLSGYINHLKNTYNNINTIKEIIKSDPGNFRWCCYAPDWYTDIDPRIDAYICDISQDSNNNVNCVFNLRWENMNNCQLNIVI